MRFADLKTVGPWFWDVKGDDKKSLGEAAEAGGGEAVIPTLSARQEQRRIDPERQKDQNLDTRFWHKARLFRRVAACNEKTARNFLGLVPVASVTVLLR